MTSDDVKTKDDPQYLGEKNIRKFLKRDDMAGVAYRFFEELKLGFSDLHEENAKRKIDWNAVQQKQPTLRIICRSFGQIQNSAVNIDVPLEVVKFEGKNFRISEQGFRDAVDAWFKKTGKTREYQGNEQRKIQKKLSRELGGDKEDFLAKNQIIDGHSGGWLVTKDETGNVLKPFQVKDLFEGAMNVLHGEIRSFAKNGAGAMSVLADDSISSFTVKIAPVSQREAGEEGGRVRELVNVDRVEITVPKKEVFLFGDNIKLHTNALKRIAKAVGCALEVNERSVQAGMVVGA